MRNVVHALPALAAAAALLAGCPPEAAPPSTELISVAADGGAANAWSWEGSLSDDGRFVAFISLATNLTSDGEFETPQVFLRDRAMERTTLVSRAVDGGPSVGYPNVLFISGDGRHVGFTSDASDLVPGDANAAEDAFVFDVLTGMTERVSVSSEGDEANEFSRLTAISDDGRYALFGSAASNLVGEVGTSRYRFYVRDRALGRTELIGPVFDDGKADGELESYGGMSGDGRFVAFAFSGLGLIEDDVLGPDAFLLDRATGGVTRISLYPDNHEEGWSFETEVSISSDGGSVVFSVERVEPGERVGVEEVWVYDVASGAFSFAADVSYPGYGNHPAVSWGGRYVGYHYYSGDERLDVYLTDLESGENGLAVLSDTGGPPNASSSFYDLTSDGRFFTFGSDATDIGCAGADVPFPVCIRDRGWPLP